MHARHLVFLAAGSSLGSAQKVDVKRIQGLTALD